MHFVSARTKRNTLKKQKAVKPLGQSAISITRPLVSIPIIRIERLHLPLISLAIDLKSNSAAESSLGLVVTELDKVAVLAADVDAERKMVFADVHHIDVVLLFLAVFTRVAGGEGIELVRVYHGWLICARKT